MIFKKSPVLLFVALLISFMSIAPSSATLAAYIPPAQIGEILTVDGIQYQVLGRGEGSRQVLIYDYPDVSAKSVTLPTMISSGGYDWTVTGILSRAFKNCTTPKTIIISKDSNINWYYMCPDAFINGAAQTIQVNAADGEWDTLYHILEYNNPKSAFPANIIAERIPGYSSFTNTANTEDTLYINIPAGTYTLAATKAPEKGSELRVYSNTTLYLKDVTFKRPEGEQGLKSHMLTLGTTDLTNADGTKNATGYNGGKNIKILYGTFDNGTTAGANNICRGSHLENVTIQGTTFKYLPKTALTSGMTNSHCIEIAGVKKFTIKSCKFYNNANCLFNNEAVQIESCSADPDAQTHTNVAAPLDDTQTSNVTITKCRFEGFNYGCGSNHLGPDDVCTNMKFTKNTFIGCQKYCICLYNYNKVTITGNKLKDCNSLLLDPKDHKSTKITQKKNKTIK